LWVLDSNCFMNFVIYRIKFSHGC